MPKQQPIILKVGSKGAYVNLNSTVSIGIVEDQVHNRVKEDWVKTEDQPEPLGKDIEAYQCDTIAFYFIGRDELILRVGYEITKEEFEAIKKIVEEIVYEPRDVRVPVTK